MAVTVDGTAEPRPHADDGRARALRSLLLAAVAACAACGLVYELCLLTLSSTLIGGGIVATSLVVAGYVAALGVGALLAKPLVPRAAAAFLGVEVTLGVLGGLSAMALYWSFSYYGGTAGSLLLVATAVLGALVGAEIPLLMALLQRGRTTDATESGRLVANLTAADYLGALAGGLAWPFLLLPAAGQIRGAVLTGLVNLAGAAVVTVLVRDQLSRLVRGLAPLLLAVAAVVLGVAAAQADDFEVTSRQRLYADPIVHAERSRYQEIVLTERHGNTRLYLDGDLQFASHDEHRYTEALVLPALSARPRRVAILGGGDGLAARDALRVPGVEEVVQVELDDRVTRLARTRLADLNDRSLDDPRVTLVHADAFAWLREQPPGSFDAVVVDLPDPDTLALGRLYSTEFYGLVARVLTERGLVSVQSGSPYATPTAYWRTVSTVRSAGLAVTPFHVDVPSFGDWGFALARRGAVPPPLQVPAGVPVRFLSGPVLEAAAVFPPDRAPQVLEPSTLDRPRIVDDVRQGYTGLLG